MKSLDFSKYNRGNYVPPKKIIRWKPGAKCCICGQEIKECHLSKNQIEREYQLKWCVHMECQNKCINLMDKQQNKNI